MLQVFDILSNDEKLAETLAKALLGATTAEAVAGAFSKIREEFAT